MQTTGGNSVEGARCIFPFEYKGVRYSKCTDVENDGVLWCGTSSSAPDLWGNCNGKCGKSIGSFPCIMIWNFIKYIFIWTSVSIFFSQGHSDEDIDLKTVKRHTIYNCEECLTSMGPNNRPLTWCGYNIGDDYSYACTFVNNYPGCDKATDVYQCDFCGANKGYDLPKFECPA